MYIIADGGIGCNSNTIDAIMLTKNLSYIDGIKLDVRMSLDNVLVLAEDDDLSKNTFSKEYVSKSNYHYLRKVKFQSHIFKYYIPTLNEVLKNYNKEKIIVLDIHEDERINVLINELLVLINEYDYIYYFYSSSKIVLEELKKYSLNNIIDSNNISNLIKFIDYPLFDK